MCLVSIIVPNYNHARFLKERIDSVMGQDYPWFEVILLDDCSQDQSRDIIALYANNPHVRHIAYNESNSGNTFVQWRKGIEMAQGKYIWIAESDDIAQTNFLSTLVPVLEETNVLGKSPVLAFSMSLWIDEEGAVLKHPFTHRWQHSWQMDGKLFAIKYLLGYNYICNASAVLMRRDAALQVSENCMQYRASGDRQFWLEMAQQGVVAYVAEQLNGFRQHANKVSAPAEIKGQNIVEDHYIYRAIQPQFPLSNWRKRLICGYHMWAMCNTRLSKEGKQAAWQAWAQEKEFSYGSMLLFLGSRIWDKYICCF